MIYTQRQLRLFMAIVDEGSLNRAAQVVNITQPTLSRLMAEMERKLGQRLFERNAKGMLPTAAGELLIPYARLILHEMDAADEALQALHGLQRGTVRVGAVATVARSILPPAIGQLLAQSPGLRVTLLEGPDDQIVAALLQRKIDVMITTAMPRTEGISAIRECPYDDTYATFCAADHPLAKRPVVTLTDVLDQRWTMPAAGATPRVLLDRILAEQARTAPTIAIETTSIDVMISCVAKTDLLGWLPRPLLNNAISGGLIRLLHVPELELRRRFFIYRRDRGLLPAPARELLKFIPLSPSGADQAGEGGEEPLARGAASAM
jgi:DNA-binding transcriptional LysR family regulator